MFLAIRSCAQGFAQIWQTLKCLYVSDLTTSFKVIHSCALGFEQFCSFLTQVENFNKNGSCAA